MNNCNLPREAIWWAEIFPRVSKRYKTCRQSKLPHIQTCPLFCIISKFVLACAWLFLWVWQSFIHCYHYPFLQLGNNPDHEMIMQASVAPCWTQHDYTLLKLKPITECSGNTVRLTARDSGNGQLWVLQAHVACLVAMRLFVRQLGFFMCKSEKGCICRCKGSTYVEMVISFHVMVQACSYRSLKSWTESASFCPVNLSLLPAAWASPSFSPSSLLISFCAWSFEVIYEMRFQCERGRSTSFGAMTNGKSFCRHCFRGTSTRLRSWSNKISWACTKSWGVSLCWRWPAAYSVGNGMIQGKDGGHAIHKSRAVQGVRIPILLLFSQSSSIIAFIAKCAKSQGWKN